MHGCGPCASPRCTYPPAWYEPLLREGSAICQYVCHLLFPFHFLTPLSASVSFHSDLLLGSQK